MKRKQGELFYDYCARRLLDQENTKELMKPRQLWTSVMLVPRLPKNQRILEKVRVQGTFRKSDNGGKAL